MNGFEEGGVEDQDAVRVVVRVGVAAVAVVVVVVGLGVEVVVEALDGPGAVGGEGEEVGEEVGFCEKRGGGMGVSGGVVGRWVWDWEFLGI